MKIVLPNTENGFRHNLCSFCGKDAILVTPEMDAKWNDNNLSFRSLIVSKDGEVLSSGWPKFFNYNEKPECYPNPQNYKDWTFSDKIDGSLVICDYVNGQFSMRTRGTASYITQDNAKDFGLLSKKYPKIIQTLKESPHISLLVEIVTPNNVIVVRSNEVEFYLIGAINKNDLTVISTSELTELWRKIGPMPTPQTYYYSSVADLPKIAQDIKNWKGKEGIVISYNNNQNRIKLKSDWYLFLHRVKSELSSFNNLINFYLDEDMPSFDKFYEIIQTKFDYEIAEQLKVEIANICDLGERTKQILKNIKDFACSIKRFENRKQQAEYTFTTYGKTFQASIVFCFLDNKPLTKQQLFKLMEHQQETTNPE